VGLAKAGHEPERVHTEAACTVEKVGEGFTITTMKLRTRVRAAGLDDARLQELAQQTKEGCPVSRALAGVTIEVEASLD
jgi:lipoyl-dependent peroxiredoxin